MPVLLPLVRAFVLVCVCVSVVVCSFVVVCVLPLLLSLSSFLLVPLRSP